jgi:hypothetical protein
MDCFSFMIVAVGHRRALFLVRPQWGPDHDGGARW